ncbi:MAG: sigma factor, partial [Bacillota bacterium]
DELSVAWLALNEAIDQFRPGSGTSFLAFAKVVIRRRLVDYFRNVPGQSVTTPGAEVQSRTITTPAVSPVGGETPTYPDPIGYDDPNGDRLVTVEPGGTTLNLPEVYVPTQSVTTPGMRLNQRTIETPSVCIGGGSMRTKECTITVDDGVLFSIIDRIF